MSLIENDDGTQFLDVVEREEVFAKIFSCVGGGIPGCDAEVCGDGAVEVLTAME